MKVILALLVLVMLGIALDAAAAEETCKLHTRSIGNLPGVIKLDKLNRYMKIDRDNSIHFDIKSAIEDGLPPRVIYFGLKAEKVINKMIYELKTYEKVSEETIREIDALFGPSFKYTSLSWGEACGGGYDNPHTCPPRESSGIYRDT